MTKPHKQTSPAISSIAAKYVRMTNETMAEEASHAANCWRNGRTGNAGSNFFRDIRKLAASCLSQDEVKGK